MKLTIDLLWETIQKRRKEALFQDTINYGDDAIAEMTAVRLNCNENDPRVEEVVDLINEGNIELDLIGVIDKAIYEAIKQCSSQRIKGPFSDVRLLKDLRSH